MTLEMYAPPRVADEVYYPESDGQPMAESDFQRDQLSYSVEALKVYFQDRADVYVSGNLFVYYKKGDPKCVVAPDVFVVMGVPNRKRKSYRLWNEGDQAPDWVLEITSEATQTEDQGSKRGLYAFLGVREYFQFDPTQDYLEPPLQGLKLVGRNYEPLPAHTLADGTLSIYSDVLGLEVRMVKDELRFFDPARQQWLRSLAEAQAFAETEANARRKAEAEIERLRAELARLRGER